MRSLRPIEPAVELEHGLISRMTETYQQTTFPRFLKRWMNLEMLNPVCDILKKYSVRPSTIDSQKTLSRWFHCVNKSLVLKRFRFRTTCIMAFSLPSVFCLI